MKIMLAVLFLAMTESIAARVDTLFGTTEIDDAHIYGFDDCNFEVSLEVCRRYNAGGVNSLKVGQAGVNESRAVMRFPGWDGELPDSSILELYCTDEEDTADRRIFLYPLTRRFFEGTEGASGVGDYPEPDSGVTWYHAWLDVGDGDSLCWSAPGGDRTTAVACTVIVTGAGMYHRVRPFNRILTWWREQAVDPGIILINQNAFPLNAAQKAFSSSESETEGPRLILYYSDEPAPQNRRRLRAQTLLHR